MGIKVKVDERGRITLPAEVRKFLNIEPGNEIIAEKRKEGLLISKKITPEEFLMEAEELQKKIKETKKAEEEPLRVKEIWKARE
jgi:AbrB family looped-hinge helix DNA binding protein